MASIDIKAGLIISIVVSLIIAAILLPQGLVYISEMGSRMVEVDGTNYTVSASVDGAVLTMLTTIVPLMVAIALVMVYVNYVR
jgi:hypothetical protein